ncbi:carbamoyl phosphate synthase small subunit [Buchananella felis]|uniref:carbamoyl phosphate synthase small subunit n=1 Tax=Buchananella felis TaxID=3231492 RepID=UPI003527F148
MSKSELALVVLEDGRVFRGRAYGARGRTLGKIFFSTGMTGYQEILTDPANCGQIAVMTFPHIGNTGMGAPAGDQNTWVAGLVVRDPARRAAWRGEEGELEDALSEAGVVGISHVDTRALTRHLRDNGAMRAGIFSGDALPSHSEDLSPAAVAVLVDVVRSQAPVNGAEAAHQARAAQARVIETIGGDGAASAHLVAVDLGGAAGAAQHLAQRGARISVVAQSVTLDQLLALAPDGVFFSDGPGEASGAGSAVELARGVLDAGVPFLGTGLGHQLLGRALGYGTYKLTDGQAEANGDAAPVTAVDAPLTGLSVAPHDDGRYGRVEASLVSEEGRAVEQLRALDVPAFSVQQHRGTAAGPQYSEHFDQFLSLVEARRAQGGATPSVKQEG